MKILNLEQGSPEWVAHRQTARNASEAPAMMGVSKKVTRTELLNAKCGVDREISDYVKEVIFAKGHGVEALARPFAEKIVGADLYPVVGTTDDGYLAASFDGLTMDEEIAWECKQWNLSKADLVSNDIVPPEDLWQCVQQLVVSGAERLLYMVTDGTEAGTVHCWLTLDDELQRQLLAGWRQFDADLPAHKPVVEVVEVVGKTPDSLPALRIEVTGTVTASNLDLYKSKAIEVFRNIKTDLVSDQDFADAEKTVKWCGDIEDKLKAAKQHALSQTQTIDALFRAIDEISAEAREKRLLLEKLVKSKKETIKAELIAEGKAAYTAHEDALRKDTGGPWICLQQPDFVTATKGLKTLSSMRNAISTALARAKIDADESARKIRESIAIINDAGADFGFLFADRLALISKQPDDLRLLVKSRIAEHQEKERQRLEAERARIRAEEESKAKAEAERLAEQERQRIRQEEQAKAQAEAAQAARPAPESMPGQARPTEAPAAVEATPVQAPAAAVRSGATIKLGDVNAMIAPLSISAEGLASIGFHPVRVEKAAKLYSADDLPRILGRLAQRLVDAAKTDALRRAA